MHLNNSDTARKWPSWLYRSCCSLRVACGVYPSCTRFLGNSKDSKHRITNKTPKSSSFTYFQSKYSVYNTCQKACQNIMPDRLLEKICQIECHMANFPLPVFMFFFGPTFVKNRNVRYDVRSQWVISQKKVLKFRRWLR